MLDDLLKQSQPGVNPKLEEVITSLMRSGGASPGQTQSGVQSLQGQGQPQTMGAGGAGVQPQAGGTPAMGPEEANLTYQALIRKGVPPQIAQQALANPQMLKDLLMQIYKQTGPQEAPAAMASSQPGRQSAPPLGGGGGYQ